MSRIRQHEITAERWASLPFVVRSIWGESEVDAIGADTAEDALDIARAELDQGYDVRIEQRVRSDGAGWHPISSSPGQRPGGG